MVPFPAVMFGYLTLQVFLFSGFVQWTDWAAGNLSEESAEDFGAKERD